jgi:hypothetical protein
MDWFYLLSNALWITALALALAVMSYTSWRSQIQGAAFRTVLEQAGPRFWLNLAALGFALGLALSGLAAWLRVLWLLAAGWFVYQIVRRRLPPNTPDQR